MEEARFLGDLVFYDLYLKPMANLAHPLVAIVEAAGDEANDEPAFMMNTVKLTPAGRAMLDGTEHNIRLNPIDVWRGGVHLHSGGRIWLWDETAQDLVRY